MRKIVIIDDEPLVQAGIRSMLDWESMDLQVCGVANNGQTGLELIQREDPDIVITDIKMPVMTGIDLLKAVRESHGQIRPAFIILTSYEDFQLAKETISYNIIDYLVKLELTPEGLQKSIQKAIDILKNSEPADSPDRRPNDIQALRDKFFIRLLHNLFDSEEQVTMLQKDLGLDLDVGAFQCIYFEMQNDKFENLPVARQIPLYSNSYSMVGELAAKFGRTYQVSLDRRHGVLLMLYDDPEGCDPTLLQNMAEVIDSSLSNYYGTRFYCGIGNCTNSRLGISDSYMNARKAFTILSKDKVWADYDAFLAEDNSHAVFNINLFKDDLVRAYSEYDAEILQQIIGQLCDLFAEHKDQYVQALDAACNVLFLGLSLIPSGEEIISGLFQDIPDGYRSIYKQKNTDEIIAWLQLYSERLALVFEERKREHRNHIVENVKKYIDAHMKEKLGLGEVAALYGISPNYLSSLFKKYNDCGYTEYITRRKIEAAKGMMAEGKLKIYEIAEELGFESAFYFSKVFKKTEGISPTDYMNKLS